MGRYICHLKLLHFLAQGWQALQVVSAALMDVSHVQGQRQYAQAQPPESAYATAQTQAPLLHDARLVQLPCERRREEL